MKKFLSLLFTLVIVSSFGGNSFAQESDNLKNSDIVALEYDKYVASDINNEVKPRAINPLRNRKRNVRTYYEWSPYKRVSNNMVTGSSGGSISPSSAVTYSAVISGDINGLGIDVSGSITNSMTYTINVGPNQRVYMGYRAYYKVETGINEYYDAVTGRLIRSSRYTVKVPQYGEYKLLKY